VTPCHGYRVLLAKAQAAVAERDLARGRIIGLEAQLETARARVNVNHDALVTEIARLRAELSACQEALLQAVRLATMKT
jgi:hypothetical protein